jgi:phosphatidylinositol alpha-1,6-mannosyltransferase
MLALVTDGFGARGGIAQYNRDLLSAAARVFGDRALRVLPRRGGVPDGPLPPGVTELAPVPGRARYALAAGWQALTRRPAVIFCGHLYHAPLAARLAALSGARLVGQLHGIEVWGEVSRSYLRALERADLVFAVSRDTRARALARLRLPPERVVVVNNTVGPAFVPGDRRAARERFALGGETVILTVGRLDPSEAYKGQDRVIALLARLAGRGAPAIYLVAGEGCDRSRLERLAHEYGVADRVRFLGHVPDEALPDLYRAADLFALPSSGEGFGIAFLEAMACGTPAVGLAVGGAPDALGDGELGACVEPAAFADAFPRLVERGGRGGPDLAEAVQRRFGSALFADQVARHLERLSDAA